MTSSVKWYGDDLLVKISGSTEKGLRSGAEQLLETAQSKVPIRTKRLHDSGYVATAKMSTYKEKNIHRDEVRVSTGMALVGFAAFYAHMVEWGTSKMSAIPFLRPALDSTRKDLGKKIVMVMARNIK